MAQYVCVYMYMCVHICICVYIHVFATIASRKCKYIYVHTNTYIYTHAGSVKVACLHQIFNICVSDANKFFLLYILWKWEGEKKSLLYLPDMFPRGDCLWEGGKKKWEGRKKKPALLTRHVSQRRLFANEYSSRSHIPVHDFLRNSVHMWWAST